MAPAAARHTALVVVLSVNRGVAEAVDYAHALSPDRLEAVAVALDDGYRDQLTAAWAAAGIDVPLTMLDSPYRRFTEPILEHIDELHASRDGFTTVILPELAVEHVWQEGLHNQALLALAGRLRGRERTVVATYSFRPDA